jgi:hypothetical protein
MIIGSNTNQTGGIRLEQKIISSAKKLEAYFNIPNPSRTIDFQKTTLKQSVIIPKELEYRSEESKIEEDKESSKLIKIPLSSDSDSFEQISIIAKEIH